MLEVEFTARHDQHLCVGDVVRDVARDTPRQHHFLDGRRQRIRNRGRSRATRHAAPSPPFAHPDEVSRVDIECGNGPGGAIFFSARGLDGDHV